MSADSGYPTTPHHAVPRPAHYSTYAASRSRNRSSMSSITFISSSRSNLWFWMASRKGS
jgi:hypothetical protein